MNNTHRKTLEAIISDPVPAALEWRRIELLFVALGAQRVEGSGSRVAFVINGARADFRLFHFGQHPGKEAKRYQVRAAREFLQQAGVFP